MTRTLIDSRHYVGVDTQSCKSPWVYVGNVGSRDWNLGRIPFVQTDFGFNPKTGFGLQCKCWGRYGFGAVAVATRVTTFSLTLNVSAKTFTLYNHVPSNVLYEKVHTYNKIIQQFFNRKICMYLLLDSTILDSCSKPPRNRFTRFDRLWWCLQAKVRVRVLVLRPRPNAGPCMWRGRWGLRHYTSAETLPLCKWRWCAGADWAARLPGICQVGRFVRCPGGPQHQML